MAFQVSPGVNVSEVDLTTIVPAVSTSAGALAGLFRWGPIGQIVLVDSEDTLVRRFGKPTNFNAETFFTAANFLAYGNQLYVSRAANTTANTGNATYSAVAYNYNASGTQILDSLVVDTSAGGYNNSSLIIISGGTLNAVATLTTNSTGFLASVNVISEGRFPGVVDYTGLSFTIGNSSSNATSTGTASITGNSSVVAFSANNTSLETLPANSIFNVINSDDYQNKYDNGNFAYNPDILYIAKYPGALGNTLSISVVDTPYAFSSNLENVSNTSFTIGGNTGTIGFTYDQDSINAATVVANLTSYAAYSDLTVGDYITVGNGSIGFQILQVSDKGEVNFQTETNISLNAGNTVIDGLSSTANIKVGDVVVANDGQVFSLTGTANSTSLVTAVVNSTAIEVADEPLQTVSRNLKIATVNLDLSFYNTYTLPTVWTGSANVGRLWQYYNTVDAAPGTSEYTSTFGNTAAIDEVHVVVTDTLGKITGVPGQILEVYQGLSRATDAKTQDGATNYYVDVINQSSQYVWFANHREAGYVNTAENIASLANNNPLTSAFISGQDGFDENNVGANIGAITNAYDLFKSTETAPISLVLTGKSTDGSNLTDYASQVQLANYLIQNIAENRKDCVVFVSPSRRLVVNNIGNEYSSVIGFRNALTSSSYGVLDSGYKYQYDKYNDIYRYVPLNGDIAGLCVYTDNTRDPWWSPAGFNRGQIKNVIKLAWNPKKAERDAIYPAGINPVVTFPGQGTVLFGDKTLQAKPSAFDRINVRRLFIVLEKAIATAAQYSLFEFNDAFTRAQFVSLVTPFLKDVQGRRGIYDFRVVCDTTNNTAEVIDSNRFVGDIYIKPARSINYIQLNFVAVRTGVDFSEIVGKF